MARTVDIIGDKWAWMILRGAFYGFRTFSAFQTSLGIAKTVLSDRLQRLTETNVLEKVETREGVDRSEYRLTPAGRDLFPVVVALVQWGDRWVFGPGHAPIGNPRSRDQALGAEGQCSGAKRSPADAA